MPTVRRIALLLEYDGTRYAGSQLQPNAPTIQGALEATIEEIIEEEVRVALAGRTDAGVHARGQVAAFDTTSALAPDVLLRALNALLPRDIAVRGVTETVPGFDPRRDAVGRQYRYVIDNGATRPALGRERSWHVGGPLDVDAMAAAARLLLGERDFAAFAGAPESPDASTIRNLRCFTAERKGNHIVFHVAANAFLSHQVRRMVGALVEVGRGRLAVAGYGDLLAGPPSSAGPAAPARGLTLMQVDYQQPLFHTVEPDPVVC
jgi:tRNA pseudouridine38-40 synthase